MGITTGQIMAFKNAKAKAGSSNYVEDYQNFFTVDEFSSSDDVAAKCSGEKDKASYDRCVKRNSKTGGSFWDNANSLLANLNETIGTFKGDSRGDDSYVPTVPLEDKKLSTGALVGIILGAGVLGFGVYYLATKITQRLFDCDFDCFSVSKAQATKSEKNDGNMC